MGTVAINVNKNSVMAAKNILGASAGAEADSLDDDFGQVIVQMKKLNAVRRRHIRIELLEAADRPINGAFVDRVHSSFGDAASALEELGISMQNVIGALGNDPSRVDKLFCEIAKDPEAFENMVGTVGSEMGFSQGELNWIMKESQSANYRLGKILFDDDLENVVALIESCAIGNGNGNSQADIGQLGFPKFTGNDAYNQRITDMVIRCSNNGVTPSLFHLLLLITPCVLATIGSKKQMDGVGMSSVVIPLQPI